MDTNPLDLLKQDNAFEMLDERFKHAKTPAEQRHIIRLFLQAVRRRIVASGLIISEMQMAFMDLDRGKVSCGWLKQAPKSRGGVGDSQKKEFSRLAAVARVGQVMKEKNCRADPACKHVAKLIGSKKDTVRKWYDGQKETRDYKTVRREMGKWDDPDQTLRRLWELAD